MKFRRSAHTLAAFMILVVFAVGLVACLAAGAGSYRRLNQNSAQSYDRRTAAAYLTMQVRRGGSVSVEPFGEGVALCLTDGEYTTRIYCHGGYLMELFAKTGPGFAPEDGQPVLALESLEMQLEDRLLTLRFADGAGEQTLRLRIEVCHEE